MGEWEHLFVFSVIIQCVYCAPYYKIKDLFYGGIFSNKIIFNQDCGKEYPTGTVST